MLRGKRHKGAEATTSSIMNEIDESVEGYEAFLLKATHVKALSAAMVILSLPGEIDDHAKKVLCDGLQDALKNMYPLSRERLDMIVAALKELEN